MDDTVFTPLGLTFRALIWVQYRMLHAERNLLGKPFGRRYYGRLKKAEAYLIRRELRDDPAALGRCRRREGSLTVHAAYAGVPTC